MANFLKSFFNSGNQITIATPRPPGGMPPVVQTPEDYRVQNARENLTDLQIQLSLLFPGSTWRNGLFLAPGAPRITREQFQPVMDLAGDLFTPDQLAELREIFERQELCHARMSEAGFFAATAIYRAQLSQNSGQIIEQGITATFVRSRQQIGETIIAARAAIRGEQSLLHSRIHALFTPACLLLQNAALKLVKERQKAEIEFHGDAEGLPPATAKLRILAFMALNTSVAPLASYQVGGQISCPHPDRIYEFWVGSTGPLPAPRPVAQQTTDHPAVLERLEAAAKEQAARQAADVQEKNAWVAKEKAEALLRQNSQ